MSSLRTQRFFSFLLFALILITLPSFSKAEEDEVKDDSKSVVTPPPPRPSRKGEKRKYMVPDNDRVDAGIFYVAFAVGGNFYVEPQIKTTTKVPTGEYFKDFGFQGGIYFDYDYSALTENVPLGLRGFFGYKYILSSVHVFTFDGVVRRMFRFSDTSTFGIGMGGSAAVWYRSDTVPNAISETIFLPSFIVTAGFEFNPFMVDFKWLINRFQTDNTITGFELYFGLRL